MQIAMVSGGTASVAMILAVLSFVAVSCLLPAALADAGLIASTCQKTSNAARCVAVLGADSRSADASNEHDLAGVALDIAVDSCSDGRGVIDDMAKKNEGTPVGDALRACDGGYSDALNDLDIDARDGFDAGQYADALRLLSGAKGAGDRCEEAFSGINVKSPVSDVDQKMTERCAVAADLVGLLVAA